MDSSQLTTPLFTLADLLSLCSLMCQAWWQLWPWTGDKEGKSGRSALVDSSPALGPLSFRNGLCGLAHVDAVPCSCPSWSCTATAWPPVTVSRTCLGL